MNEGCFLGIDQGSSSTKAVAVGMDGTVLAEARRELSPPFRDGARVEQDAEEILVSVQQVIDETAEHTRARGHLLLGIGLSCQRSSCLAWSAATGAPLSPVLSWRDTRGSGLVDGLTPRASMIFERTGLPLTPYYAASKLRWLEDTVPPARDHNAVLGTLSSFLGQRLTGSTRALIDHTQAARTQLMDLRSLSWDQELLGLFGISAVRLPEIVPTVHPFGAVATSSGPVPLLASLGDQQAAMLGLGVSGEGQGGINYGTGGFLMVNTGPDLRPVNGLMASVHYSQAGRNRYLIEGSVNAVGDALAWLRTNLRLFQDPSEIDGLCRTAKTDTAVFLGLNGTGAPHWEKDIESSVYGLSYDSTAADIVRGAVEGIAFFTADIARTLADAGIEPSRFTVSGGLASLRYLVEAQAALLGTELAVSSGRETSALGAAYLAGMGHGAWTADECAGFAPPASPVASPRDERLQERYRRWRELHRATALLGRPKHTRSGNSF